MIRLRAEKASLLLEQAEPVVSGQVDAVGVELTFSAEWEGLTKTVVFRSGRCARDVLLADGTARCMVPWEVVARPGGTLRIGVYGVRDSEMVLPTVWCECGPILPGTEPAGCVPAGYERDVFGRIVQLCGETRALAQSVRDDADAGKFLGRAFTYADFTAAQLAALRGEQGVPGPAGPEGPRGATGETGPAGPAGPTGPGGPAGPKGEQWETGPAGPTGPTGPTGAPGLTPYIGENDHWFIGTTDTGVSANGLPGETGAQGAAGPAGPTGNPGADGVTFTPSVSADGVLSWTNDGGRANPAAVSVKGPAGEAGVPIGGIILWSGAASAIPAGWALCNGSNGTPDLRGRFVIGAGGSYSVGNTGGEESVTLTLNQIPAHSHSIGVASIATKSGGTFRAGTGNYYSGIAGSTDSAGGGKAHNNLPPYYALCYLMRTA